MYFDCSFAERNTSKTLFHILALHPFDSVHSRSILKFVCFSSHTTLPTDEAIPKSAILLYLDSLQMYLGIGFDKDRLKSFVLQMIAQQ